MARTLSRNRERGFTLLELMIVIVLVGIMATFSLASYQKMTQAKNIENDLSKITRFIKAGRVWAFTHKQEVTVSLLKEGTSGDKHTTIVSRWDDAGTGTDTQKEVVLNYIYASNYGSDSFSITSRGNLANGHIRLLADNRETALSNPAATGDCITINNIRVRQGKYDGTSCTAE
ncbi:pilus assembly FimT family protein [Desulfotalea psychrophila]|uniref:Related to fimbrial biogenesis protein FimU n=1 Tax=Desulfotalea psychrophila (strain LSv54 / DSM 12343) TaxID=177439 RepID=Q6AN77_DESPS|nr:prepilin-type N-terminal cleavage/methylation domain-containing protein [Desulfotalea psychrophila]CAG36197.1 related to fimbrial biogenesis protein FimU [Desulfotalea psychrophila LSv54]